MEHIIFSAAHLFLSFWINHSDYSIEWTGKRGILKETWGNNSHVVSVTKEVTPLSIETESL